MLSKFMEHMTKAMCTEALLSQKKLSVKLFGAIPMPSLDAYFCITKWQCKTR